MLEEAASYYSQLALELLCCISYADYIQKVVWLLIQEQERADQYLKQASLKKLLEIAKWKLMGKTTQVLIQKQKAESCNTITQQLISWTLPSSHLYRTLFLLGLLTCFDIQRLIIISSLNEIIMLRMEWP
ncbi:hypothetical protein RGQ29_014066 [Quercus rubra]|uniref:Cullin N-terminal domain-containing protein n=1 Tax=Quercus rubra TaxID=3512 RepID=A0AAN7J2L1_QUERU|nr:hypothetical protein RGQ29_014066 [Quercus rubra]